jgi:hypothetical protein
MQEEKNLNLFYKVFGKSFTAVVKLMTCRIIKYLFLSRGVKIQIWVKIFYVVIL